ncbi:MAG: ribonuclease P protein component [Candidatus Omnitrophota bacterium]
MKRHSLLRLERITRTCEFKKALKNGIAHRGKTLNLSVAQNNRGISRIGICLRRENFKLAAQRNKLRRYLKEMFRLNKHIFKKGYDIIAIPKRGCVNLTFSELQDDFIETVKKAGILTTA